MGRLPGVSAARPRCVRSGAGALLRKAFPVVAPCPGSLPKYMNQGGWPAEEKRGQEEAACVLAELPWTSLELAPSPGAETQDWS